MIVIVMMMTITVDRCYHKETIYDSSEQYVVILFETLPDVLG